MILNLFIKKQSTNEKKLVMSTHKMKKDDTFSKIDHYLIK